VTVEPPPSASILVTFVVQRKARFLQRGEITADRSCRHVQVLGESLDRGAMT